MKKGFTLIELLAVIIILGIIALVAIPVIGNIIDEARVGTAEQNAISFVDTVDKQITINSMNSNNADDINDGTYTVPLDFKYNVKLKGQTPTSGWLEVSDGSVSKYSLVIGGYTITYNGISKSIVEGTVVSNQPKIIYRYSSDELYVGDKIDLKNKKITSHHVWSDSQNKYIDPNETNDMVGIYSTDLEDVLTVSTNYNGNIVTERNSVVYLKHTVDEDGIITKSETCVKTSWGTFCQTGGEGEFNLANGQWNDPKYEAKKSTLLDFYKWNTSTNTSEYSGFSCSVYSSDSYCISVAEGSYIHSIGDAYSFDYAAHVNCGVYANGRSKCWE